MTIYLAGPIHDCSDAEAMSWRDEAREHLQEHYEIRDPMRRDYREGKSDLSMVVSQDLDDILQSDIVLAYAWKASVGTSMEVWEASQHLGKTVIVVAPDECSLWLRYCADHLVHSLQDAYILLVT